MCGGGTNIYVSLANVTYKEIYNWDMRIKCHLLRFGWRYAANVKG